MTTRAYAIHRPIGMGTYPTEYRDKITEIVNFDHMQWVDCINRYAFGYIDYEIDVPKDVLDRYELLTDPGEDKVLDGAAKVMAECVKNEDWDRFNDVWTKLDEEYGYSDDEISRALARHGIK